MTLHQLFDLSTMEHRHLLLSYGSILVVQLAYLLWVLVAAARLRRPRP